MLKRLFIVLFFLALVFGGIFGWKYYQMQQAARSPQVQPPATVATVVAERTRWQPYLRAVGSLVATQGIAVSNEVAGKVASIAFDSGERADAGQLLVQMDESVDRAQLEGLLADERLAQLRFNRSLKLVKEKTVSQADLDEARAHLDAARAAVASQQALIAKKAIRAPFAGLLGIRQVDVGEYLDAGSAIVALEALDPIYVDYSLPEREFQRVAVGQPVEVRVPAWPERVFRGQVSALDARIETATRSLLVRATLENPEAVLRPGMFAEVQTALPESGEVLVLPRTAITYAPYGDSVFVVTEGEAGPTVQRRRVTTGAVRDGMVAISEGLEAGEQVVAAGQVKLRNDQPVQIDNTIVPQAKAPQ